jgi:hypothetical protein
MGGLNRIVVDYGEYKGLILLGAIDTETGLEVSRNELEKLEGFDIVKKYDGLTDIREMKSLISNNQEGFVIRFHKSGVRAKIKGDEYVRLHRLLTNFSNIDIWECLKNKTDFNGFLERVPDEFDIKVKNYVEKLKKDFFIFNEKVQSVFNDFVSKRPGFPFDNIGKKEYSMWVKEQPREYQPILFLLYDGRDYSDIIWEKIKPKYDKNW